MTLESSVDTLATLATIDFILPLIVAAIGGIFVLIGTIYHHVKKNDRYKYA